MTFLTIDSLFRQVRRNYARFIPGIFRNLIRTTLAPVKNRVLNIFPTPQVVMLGVTNRCQSKCCHCGMSLYKRNSSDELSTREIFSLLEDIAKLGTKWIYYFGGEPLLRQDILSLITHSRSLGLKTRLDTNGYLLSRKVAQDLAKSGLDKIGISIDAPDSSQHDALRGLAGSFEKAVEGIKSCIKEDIYCYISTYATKENIGNGNLQALIKLAESLKVNHIRILLPVCSGEFIKAPEMGIGHEARLEIMNMTQRPGFVFFEERPVDRLEEGYCSSLKKRFVYISCYGEVQPCSYVPLSFGSIRSELLVVILKRLWKHPLFNLTPDDCIMNNDLFRQKYMPMMGEQRKLPINVEEL